MRALIDIGISYDDDIDKAISVLEKYVSALLQQMKTL